MSDFDQFDDQLSNALRLRSPDIDGSGLETAAAHDTVLARARGIRRRRAAITGAVTMLVLVIGGFVLFNGADEDTLAPATQPPTTRVEQTAPATSIPRTPTSTATTVGPVKSSSPSTEPATTSRPQVTTTTNAPAATATEPPIALTIPEVPGVTAPDATSSSSSSSSTTIADQGTAPFTKTYNSSGGSITVTWDGSALSLGAVNPADDHTSEIEDNSALRIRVRFRGPAESRIEVRVEDGQVVERID